MVLRSVFFFFVLCCLWIWFYDAGLIFYVGSEWCWVVGFDVLCWGLWVLFYVGFRAFVYFFQGLFWVYVLIECMCIGFRSVYYRF